MLDWIAAHQMFLVLIILLDGLVLNYLDQKKPARGAGGVADFDSLWQMSKAGEVTGLMAIGLTALALVAGLLLGATLLLRP